MFLKKSFTLTELMIGMVIFLVFVLTITGLMFFGQNSLLRNNNFLDSLQSSRNGIDRLVKELKLSRFEKIAISGTGESAAADTIITFQIPINDFDGTLSVSSGEIVWGDGDTSGRWISYYVDNKMLLRESYSSVAASSKDVVIVARNIENILFSRDSNGEKLIEVDIFMTDGVSRSFIVSPKN
ncbi:MAG: hypothetical protein PHP69_00710 [Candidatus Omnitrophica bacterium]|nr:hypothetical protein [Candidatus Omnitrophota bacterium]MDD5441724.1 hypothetical protein [Candidatus Omnitrophota bacterium]